MEQTTEQFDAWALLEIMGHTKVAGKARTVPFGSTVMVHVDIPETTTQPTFTKWYSMSSIFSITFVTQELAQMHAEAYKIHPITEYSVLAALEKKMNKEVNERVDKRLIELGANNPTETEEDTIEKQKEFHDTIEKLLENAGYYNIDLDGDIISPYYFEARTPEYVALKLIELERHS